MTNLSELPCDTCQDLRWSTLHIGPVRRDWPRCPRCRAYLVRTELPNGLRYYIRHIEEKAEREAQLIEIIEREGWEDPKGRGQ